MKSFNKTKSVLDSALCVCIGGFVLMAAAVYNGYPIVYSDTSTYLSSGFEVETPFDRPIAYGLFLRLTSLNGFSMWGVVLAQGIIVSYLIWLALPQSSKIARTELHLVTLVLLTIATSISWTVSQLMPDIFTPVIVLAVLLISTNGLSRGHRLVVLGIYLIACCMHLSHPLYGIGLSLFSLSVKLVFKRTTGAALHTRSMLTLLFLSLVSILTMGSAMSKSRPIFFMGAMAEHGILKTYLDDHCPANYKLCGVKDSLPLHAYEFIWDENGPVQKFGGFDLLRDEFSEIISATLTDRKYLGLHVRASVAATIEQLTSYKIGDGWGAFGTNTILAQRLSMYCPREAAIYLHSRQQLGSLIPLSMATKVHELFLGLSILALCIPFLRPYSDQRIATVVILAAIVYNAWICGTFSNAIDRLESKVIWLVCLCAVIATVQLLKRRAGTEDFT